MIGVHRAIHAVAARFNAPTLMGRKMFREDNLKIWYTHVWAWTDNKYGLFANFNPSVQCRGSDAKVYTPTIDLGSL